LSIAIKLSGFFFLLIIVTNLASDRFGYKTFDDVDVKTKLQTIKRNPKKFKIGVAIIIIEHLSIISLSISLFFAFSHYNVILGIIWCIFRIGEALIQIYDKQNYWGLLHITKEYSDNNDDKKDTQIDLARSIIQTKTSRFSFAQILFSIGTFTYSILFILYGVVPITIGWFGIIASILYGLGNVIFRIISFKGLWSIGGLLILLFEIILGGWLLFFT